MAGLSSPVTEAPALPVLCEPVELLAELRALATASGHRARKVATAKLAAYAWDQCGPAYASAGASFSDVHRAFANTSREVWLWVHGNRSWNQLGVSLNGRVLRRVA